MASVKINKVRYVIWSPDMSHVALLSKHGEFKLVPSTCIALYCCTTAAVASMRQTEALASVKLVQMPFLHWTYSIWIAPIVKRINWFASVTILVWQRHWQPIKNLSCYHTWKIFFYWCLYVFLCNDFPLGPRNVT